MAKTSSETTDLLHGWKEIGDFLRITAEQARCWARDGHVPTFKMGRSVCARRSSILKAIEAKEATNG